MRELNRLFVAAGFWSDPEGLFFLSRNEVRDALWDYCCAWVVGGAFVRPVRDLQLLSVSVTGKQRESGVRVRVAGVVRGFNLK